MSSIIRRSSHNNDISIIYNKKNDIFSKISFSDIGGKLLLSELNGIIKYSEILNLNSNKLIHFYCINKNYKRVAEVHFEAGYVPKDQDVDAFAQALRAVGEPIFGEDASKISMAKLLTQ